MDRLHNLISLLFCFAVTFGVNAADVYFDDATNTLIAPETVHASRKFHFRGQNSSKVNLDGDGFVLEFGRTPVPELIVHDGIQASLSNVVLREFSSSYVSLGSGASLVFKDGVVIEPCRVEDLTMTWSFVEGSSVVSGYGCTLNSSNWHSIIVFPHVTLRLEDIRLTGVGGTALPDADGNYATTASYIRSTNNLRCIDDTAKIVLRNVDMRLASDFTFTTGQIDSYDDVNISGLLKKFIYTSPSDWRIMSDSTVMFDRTMTLQYASVDTNPETVNHHVTLTTPSSRIWFNGCTLHMTQTGLLFNTGIMSFSDDVTIISDATLPCEASGYDGPIYVDIAINTRIHMSTIGPNQVTVPLPPGGIPYYSF